MDNSIKSQKNTSNNINKTCTEEYDVFKIENKNEEKNILGDNTFNFKNNIHACELVNLIYGLHYEKCNPYVLEKKKDQPMTE